jgi:hypothetical protein
VAHACNPSYSGGSPGETVPQDPISEKNPSQKRGSGVVQGSPEFKPQYHTHTHTKTDLNFTEIKTFIIKEHYQQSRCGGKRLSKQTIKSDHRMEDNMCKLVYICSGIDT